MAITYVEAFTRKSQAETWAKRFAKRWGKTMDVRPRQSAGQTIWCVCYADQPGNPTYNGGFCRGAWEIAHP